MERHAEKSLTQGRVMTCAWRDFDLFIFRILQNICWRSIRDMREGQPLTITGLAREGKILFPVQKDKEAVKVERS